MATRFSAKDKRVFDETLKSARLGAADAQYEVGLMYANGIGVLQDIAQAVHWVSQAAQRGLAAAQYLLATRYESGIGVEQSVHSAKLWFAKAAEQGHSKAQLRLGVLYGKTHTAQAMQFLRSAADAGLAQAQLALANAYLQGDGMEQDPAQAIHWYQAAASQGLPEAQHALGEALLKGVVSPPDTDAALVWYRKAARQDHLAAQVAIETLEQEGQTIGSLRGLRVQRHGQAERRRNEGRWIKAAEQGNSDARYHLGQMYERGLGLDADFDSALYWYGVAAQQGHARAQLALARLSEAAGLPDVFKWYLSAAKAGLPQAQFALGQLYLYTSSGMQDPLESLDLWMQAARQEHPQALAALGHWMLSDTRELGLLALRKAAQLGEPQAQFLLGQQLEQGKTRSQHGDTALEWYEKAAHQGHAGGQCALGVAYLRGKGVAKNFKVALQWLLKAAEQGDARAQWNLGALYAAGADGLTRDLKLAFQWFQRSADQGFVAASSNLGILYALTGLPERAVAEWKKAAMQEDPEAQYNLALAYTKGEGVEKDEIQALSLLGRAAELGVVAAQSRLGLMYVTGEGAALDPIEGHKWLFLAAESGDASARANLERSLALNSPKQTAEGQRRANEWKSRALSRSDKQTRI
ncbi:hypothetical protein [Rhodoferax sp. GW822-FHT02A01]|uniref:SEL1-like repeat protein n=1 Tax=Rhodoferax sp. GW822-FHT02A01 TaxID=3141537 RepID=UPI00315C806F